MRLTVENLGLNRAGREIVSNISFELTSGETLVVSGTNGSGKSTTLRGLAGLLPIQNGTCELMDGNNQRAEYPLPEYCHYLGHQNAMKPELSVHENLSFWQNFCGEKNISIEDALKQVDLIHALDMPYSYLSSGQKRRVAITRFLLNHRPIWIMDEPTTGLDANSVKIYTKLVKAHCKNDGILIVATHLPLGLSKTKTLDLTDGVNKCMPC